MKHVWILNHYAQIPDGSGGIRHYGLASHLSRYGWTASLIAASFAHSTRHQRLHGVVLRKLEELGEVRCLWLRTPGYRGNGFGRVVNMAAYALAVLLPGATRGLIGPDLVIGSTVHPLAAWAGVLLARRHRVPFVFEVRDLWPQTLIDMGKLSATQWTTRILYWLEHWLVQQAKLVVVLLPRATDYYQNLGMPADRVLFLPNGAEVPGQAPLPPPLRKDFTLMYCGAMGLANALDTLLDSLALIERNWRGGGDFKCRLVGDGPMRKAHEERAKKLGLRVISFEPPVPKKGVSRLLSEADAFVITVKDLPHLYRFGISMNKIFDYMAAGRPTLLAAAVPENPIALSGGGIVVPPDSPGDLADAILALAKTPKPERDAMGLRAWHYAYQHYHYRHLAKCLAKAMDRVICEAKVDSQ